MPKKETPKVAPKACPVKGLCKKLTGKQKIVIILGIGCIAAILLMLLLNHKQQSETKIHTPVISRTELHKKPSIQIEIFDPRDVEEQEVLVEQTEQVENTFKENNEQSLELIEDKKLVTTVQKVTNNKTLEAKVTELEQTIKELQANNITAQISEIKTKLAKLESLEGNVGKTANIFLGQQLVMLDNAFKVGGNQNIAIQNIKIFAESVAKKPNVAKKLHELLNLTREQAIITPQALLFYARKLENIKLQETVIENEKPKGFIAKIKHLLKSFVKITKKDKLTADKLYWNSSISTLQESIIFADYVTTNKILEDEILAKLGGEELTNFHKLFNTYLDQQQALQAVLGTFIEGYSYDY
ncbi:MAG: hypothetical protein GY793_06105 [Proteobacteria bacterium]|nr:hypothetical protein [Pseudomonadota bacterium]